MSQEALQSELHMESNIMVELPANLKPPVSDIKAITLANAVPSPFTPMTISANNTGSNITFQEQIGSTVFMQNTIPITFSLDFNVGFGTAFANVDAATVSAISAVIWGANGQGKLCTSMYGIVQAIDNITVRLNSKQIFNESAFDDIMKCIIPYSDANDQFECSMPGFADPSIYQNLSAPIPFIGPDNTTYYKYLSATDAMNIYSSSTNTAYNNRGIPFKFKNVTTTSCTMTCIFTLNLPIYVFSPPCNGEILALTGIDQL